MKRILLSIACAIMAGYAQVGSDEAFASATRRGAGMDRQASPARRLQPVKLNTTWSMPWQLTPLSRQPKARRETIVSARVPSLGLVRGTRSAVTYVATPLPSRTSARNRVLEPCRRLVNAEARRFGAVRVEAASQGAERRRRDGGIEGPIGFRILYASDTGYVVRQSVLNCRANARGRIVATDVVA